MTTTESAPPPPPRELTPAVRRRAWGEPRVRFWWLAAVVLLAIAGYVLVSRGRAWYADHRLIRQGVPVQATVLGAGDQAIAGKRQPANSPVALAFHLGGHRHKVRGTLEGWREQIVVGSEVPIRVDPDDPTRWTARTDPPSLVAQLIGGLIVVPLVLALLAVADLLRRGVLATYRDAPARLAIVVEVHQSAIAPRSQLVRCAPRDGTDKRVLTVFVPRRLGKVETGDPIWVLSDPHRPGRALAARVYAKSEVRNSKYESMTKVQ